MDSRQATSVITQQGHVWKQQARSPQEPINATTNHGSPPNQDSHPHTPMNLEVPSTSAPPSYVESHQQMPVNLDVHRQTPVNLEMHRHTPGQMEAPLSNENQQVVSANMDSINRPGSVNQETQRISPANHHVAIQENVVQDVSQHSAHIVYEPQRRTPQSNDQGSAIEVSRQHTASINTHRSEEHLRASQISHEYSQHSDNIPIEASPPIAPTAVLVTENEMVSGNGMSIGSESGDYRSLQPVGAIYQLRSHLPGQGQELETQEILHSGHHQNIIQPTHQILTSIPGTQQREIIATGQPGGSPHYVSSNYSLISVPYSTNTHPTQQAPLHWSATLPSMTSLDCSGQTLQQTGQALELARTHNGLYTHDPIAASQYNHHWGTLDQLNGSMTIHPNDVAQAVEQVTRVSSISPGLHFFKRYQNINVLK